MTSSQKQGLELKTIKDFRLHEAKSIIPDGMGSNNFVAQDYPWVYGDFEIDNCLKSLNPLQACWLVGDTYYGDIYIKSQNWGTYTRPIFAYLDYVGRYPVAEHATLKHSFSQTRGFTQSFTETISVGYSVSANIDIVNVSSSIEVGFEASQAWSESTTESWETTLQGPGTFYTYQIVLVYAHNATSAGNQCASYFPYHRTQQVGSRNDLYYLSAIAKNDMLTITQPVTPLTWNQVQQYVLFDHWGQWLFDWSAYDNHRY